jgi:putative flippase GtrA
MDEPQTWPPLANAGRLLRYYGAGLVNTMVGYGLYAAFVALGLDIYLAQALGHVLGMSFNYFSLIICLVLAFCSLPCA